MINKKTCLGPSTVPFPHSHSCSSKKHISRNGSVNRATLQLGFKIALQIPRKGNDVTVVTSLTQTDTQGIRH